jgi:hypothetical protein
VSLLDKVLGSMGKTLLLLGLGLSLCLTTLSVMAAGLPRPALDFPLPIDSYHDQQVPSLFGKLTGRIQREPLNLVATIIFFGAIVHTFMAGWFRKIAHNYQQSYDAIEYLLEAKDDPPDFGKKHDKLLFRAQLFYFMSEVEAIFGIWLIPLFVAIAAFHGWATMVEYVGHANVADAIFVVVIMAMASSLPIIRFTETLISKVSAVGRGTPASWWLAILTLAEDQLLDCRLGRTTRLATSRTRDNSAIRAASGGCFGTIPLDFLRFLRWNPSSTRLAMHRAHLGVLRSRQTALFIGRIRGRLSLKELGQLAGGIHHNGVRIDIRRFTQRLQSDHALLGKISLVQKELETR